MGARKTIELTEAIEDYRSHHNEVGLGTRLTAFYLKCCWHLVKFAAVLAVLIAACYAVQHYCEQGRAWLNGKVEEVQAAFYERITIEKPVVQYKEVDDATLDEIIVKVAKEYKIDPLVLRVIASKESAGGKLLYRFEPGLFSDLSRKKLGVSDDEVRMLASSHGSFHVLGITAKQFCNMHWSKLYDTWASARCAASYVARIDEENRQIKNPGDRLWATFKAYNGSGDAASRYADSSMRLVGDMLYSGLVTR